MLARTIRVAAIAALFAAGCSHAPASAPSQVTVAFCGGGPQAMPAVVQVVCNTDDITAGHLVWTDWGSQTATANGTAVVDLCAYEDCHTGSFGSVRIKLIASKITKCPKNVRAYSTLRYVFADGTPWPGIPANVSTSGYMAAPGRPLPPANQTVALACP